MLDMKHGAYVDDVGIAAIAPAQSPRDRRKARLDGDGLEASIDQMVERLREFGHRRRDEEVLFLALMRGGRGAGRNGVGHKRLAWLPAALRGFPSDRLKAVPSRDYRQTRHRHLGARRRKSHDDLATHESAATQASGRGRSPVDKRRLRDRREDPCAHRRVGTETHLHRKWIGRAEIKPDRADVSMPWQSQTGHTKTSVTESSTSLVGVLRTSLWSRGREGSEFNARTGRSGCSGGSGAVTALRTHPHRSRRPAPAP